MINLEMISISSRNKKCSYQIALWCIVHLYDGVAPCGRFDSSPASLGLVVSPVVRLRLHLNVELILVGATGDGPLQRRQGRYGDATEHREQ